MTQLTNAEFKTQTASLFATNGIGAISATDLRTQMDNLPDSILFKTTGKTTAPGVTDDGVNTSGNGIFEVGDIWVDETADKGYMNLDNTTSNAVWLSLTNEAGADILATIDAAIGSNDWQSNVTPTTIVIDATTARVLSTADLNGDVIIKMTNASANTITIDTGLVDTGVVTVIQFGAGQTTIVQGTATLFSANGDLLLANQYSSCSIIPMGSDVYVVVGDLTT